MFTSALHTYLRDRSLRLQQHVVQAYQQEERPQRKPRPTMIAIQWFLLNVAIEEQVYTNGEWTISQTKASHLASSANPEENGNIIIYGHNTREIMGNIRALKGNERIHVTTEDGEDHQYKITGLYEVDPQDTRYLQPTQEETLTLYTCSGLLDRKRFVVQAKPL